MLLGCLTITLSSSTITRLFNDYNATESYNPPKTHKTPPQNCLQRGSFMSLNSRKPYFKRFLGIMKTNPNFNTNAPPFEVRGCKVILGGCIFLSRGCKLGLSEVHLDPSVLRMGFIPLL